MKINKIKKEVIYADFGYDYLKLNDINLIVGKNATGKTRTLVSICRLIKFITNEKNISTGRNIDGKYIIEFKDKENTYIYEVDAGMIEPNEWFDSFEIFEENLYVNGKDYLTRNRNGTGKIFSELNNGYIDFSIDTNSPAIYMKRDKIHHPVLEKINNWCKNNIYISFGTYLGRNVGLINKDLKEEIKEDYFTDVDKLARNLKIALENKEYGNKLKEVLLNQMNDLNYNITDIKISEIKDSIYGIKIKEKDNFDYISQLEMSQGMFRAFSVLTHSLINVYENKANLIVIDDIGEGLDFERSTKLIELLEKNAKASNSQLIMSTNDRHIMNYIPIKYWQIIVKDKGQIKFYSYEKNKEIFEYFKLTGLSNFDFLSTEFYLQDIE